MFRLTLGSVVEVAAARQVAAGPEGGEPDGTSAATESGGAAAAHWRADLERSLATCGMLVGFMLVAFDIARVWHQTWLFFGPDEPLSLELARIIVNGTLWGSGWKVQTIAASLAAVAYAAAYRSWPGGWLFVYPAVLMVGISRPLTGHALEQGSWLSLPVILQAVHVLAAGIWIGTLLAIVAIGVRHARRLPGPDRGTVVAAMVNAFSPIALGAVTALFIAGTATSFMYLGSTGALLGTTYGLVLLAKAAGFATVAGIGFFNWQRVRPSLGSETAESVLLRSAGLELVVAAIVLALTAVLVALPMPMG